MAVHLRLNTVACPHRNMEGCLLLSMEVYRHLNTVDCQHRSMEVSRRHNTEDYRLLSMEVSRRPKVGVCLHPPCMSIEATSRRGRTSSENWKREGMTAHPK